MLRQKSRRGERLVRDLRTNGNARRDNREAQCGDHRLRYGSKSQVTFVKSRR